MTQQSIPDSPFELIHDAVSHWAMRQPDTLAVKDAFHTLSYRALYDTMCACAQEMRAQGIRGGDRLLLVGENSVALGVLVLASSVVGAWTVVVNARLSSREVDSIAQHADARRIIFLGQVSPEAAAHAHRHGATAQSWPGVGSLLVGRLHAAAQAEGECSPPGANVALLIYTSGTSGRPKGVMLTHASINFIAQVLCTIRKIGPGDVVYGVLPMAHVVGLSTQFIGALAAGATLLLVPRYAPEALAHALANEGVTLFTGVPVMFARLLEWSRLNGHPLHAPRLRAAGASGSPLTPELKQAVERALGLVLQNNYGLTETSPTVAQTRLDTPRTDCSVGFPIPGVEIKIVQPNRAPVARGQVGELCVRGPNLMKGYYKNPELTHMAIDAEEWFRTGDLARQAPDGALFIVGRSKELIIRSGFNVYPTEVEQVLDSHPEVVQSAVVGRHTADNEEVIAFIETVRNVVIDATELQAFLRERLSPYKMPSEIRRLDQLPASSTGKILKSVLAELAAAPV